MASITITVPDNILTRVLNGVASNHGYTGKDPNGNDETKAQFAKRMVIKFLKESVKAGEAVAAAEAARAAAVADVDTNVTLS